MNSPRQTRTCQAFTLMELLLVIVVLAVLAIMILPAFAGTRTNAKAAQCLNNLRHLTRAWQMYTTDYADTVPPQLVVAGFLDWSASPDNTNSSKLTDSSQSPLARYVQAPDIFKCPADDYRSAANPGPRVRSYSLNGVLGGTIDISGAVYPPGRTYLPRVTKVTELNLPGPAGTSVWLAEHPDSINDSFFSFSPGRPPNQYFWRDLPASHHDGAEGISFADGHVALRRWAEPTTVNPVKFIDWPNTLVRGSVDYAWMNETMPYR